MDNQNINNKDAYYEQLIIDYFQKENSKPILDADLIHELEIESKEIGVIYDIIKDMEKRGGLLRTKKHKIGTPEVFGFITGKIQITQRGFGFVLQENSKDIFIPAKFIGGAMNGDIVMVSLLKDTTAKKPEGEVIKVLERNNVIIVGTYQENKSFGFVLPDDKKMKRDIFISKGQNLKAQNRDKVVVKITKWPVGDKKPEGKVVEVLGQKGAPGVDVLSVIRAYNLPEFFNKKVIAEAEMMPEEVDESAIEGRKDFRNKTIVTIDGKDAKDLDDAIHVEKLSNGNYELGVHIADVTHYVKEGSKIDNEAIKRATSVYLLNRVIPMLPKRLSNGICSLNPQVNRLTLSCIMEVDPEGKIVNNEIVKGVIKTKERMNYEDVSNIVDGLDNDRLKERYGYLYNDFKLMAELAEILENKRTKRGAIEFDFSESKIVLDGEGKPIKIEKMTRRVAHKMIESFMLAANETIAEYMYWLEIPFVYRIHEMPDLEKIENLNKVIYNFGHTIKGNITEEVHPKVLQKLLGDVSGEQEEHIISKLTLRSLKQAKYSPNNLGHFGLAAKYYCHFTSPIRRYPDLQIHRIIHEFLDGKLTEERKNKLGGIVVYVSEVSSERERNAEKAERDVDDMKMAEYMKNHVGEVFPGMISSVMNFGFFVELENTVEGLVRVENLRDDYYIYEDEKMRFIGERTGKVYAIGDSVTIKVDHADVDLREIDFSIAKPTDEDFVMDKLNQYNKNK